MSGNSLSEAELELILLGAKLAGGEMDDSLFAENAQLVKAIEERDGKKVWATVKHFWGISRKSGKLLDSVAAELSSRRKKKRAVAFAGKLKLIANGDPDGFEQAMRDYLEETL